MRTDLAKREHIMRTTACLILIALLHAVFPPVGSSADSCGNSLNPPFISSATKPNILIILDNSNSMDEDFHGNAVGSYSSASKSNVARKALQTLIAEIKTKTNVGLMTFNLPSNVTDSTLYNAAYFTSYKDSSFCGDTSSTPPSPSDLGTPAQAPASCVDYCETGSLGSKSSCETECRTRNPGFSADLPDAILSGSSALKKQYCSLIYPKTQRLVNPKDASHYVYFKNAYPGYMGDDGAYYYLYSGSDMSGTSYSATNGSGSSWNTYKYFRSKTETNDTSANYTSNFATTGLVPTDSDKALGFYNFGQRLYLYRIGPTWLSNSSAPTSQMGYLKLGINSLSATDSNGTPLQYDNLYSMLDPRENNSSSTKYCYNSLGVTNGTTCTSTTNCSSPYNNNCSIPYMGCTASDKNTCSYVVNAGLTPTAGTLQTALNYFKGSYSSTKYCYNSTMVSNGQTCSRTSDCTSPYNSSCSTVPTPITASCQKNYIIYVTDGQPSTKINGTTSTDITTVLPEVITQLQNLKTGVSVKLSDNKTYTFPIKTYVLGMGLSAQAKANLDQMAVAGGTQTDSDSAYYADDPSGLNDALQAIVTDLLSRVAAGSSISILSEGQTQMGANILQGVFYPSKFFGSTSIAWTGYLYDYWFYNGKSVSNIREDTPSGGTHDYILDLDQDYVLDFKFDEQNGVSIDRYWDQTGSGEPGGAAIDNVDLDHVNPLWEAGKQLFKMTASERTIYTNGGNGIHGDVNEFELVPFDSTFALNTNIGSLLGSTTNIDPCITGTDNTAKYSKLIDYVRGVDSDTTLKYCLNGSGVTNGQTCDSTATCTSPYNSRCSTLPGCRNRTVGLCTSGSDFSNTPCNTDSDCHGSGACVKNVWKLGDIVYSTPKVQMDYKYCSDGANFIDPAVSCTSDSDCGAGNVCKEKESVAFVGANDGMLHAIKTGVLTNQGVDAASHQVEKLTGIDNSEMGKELWGFIPKNSLPYLRCLAKPSTCHLYFTDLSPYIVKMYAGALGTDSKTVLIGGMRMGGAAASASRQCLNGSGQTNGNTCTKDSDCITAPYSVCSASNLITFNAPPDTCSPVDCTNSATCYNPPSCTGLSSYFALDITDVENPRLLWEFTHPMLGFSYSGPAVIRKWATTTPKSGSKYYVMFASGPTDPQDGTSSQPLSALVLSLDSDLKISSVYATDFKDKNGASINQGFGGRLFTNGLDLDGDEYTDFVLFGYGYSPSGKTGQWKGGIAKINTNNIDASLAQQPTSWGYDVKNFDNIAQVPITSKIEAMKCFDKWFIYGGTGRYFFPLDNYGPSGAGVAGKNFIFGLPFFCDQYNLDITDPSYPNTTKECGNINFMNQNSINKVCGNLSDTGNIGKAAWQIYLNDAEESYLKERVITDPTVTTTNEVFFTSAEPTAQTCGYGGRSRMWGLNCATGGTLIDTSCTGYTITDLGGTLYLQTSTGAIYKFNPSSGFTGPSTGASIGDTRTTDWRPGMPPESPVPFVRPSTGVKNGAIIHWIEK